MKDVLIASNNQGKIERYTALLQRIQPDLRVHSPGEFGLDDVSVEETANTLAENAELKARAYFGKVSMPIIANDTGFWVEGEGLVDAPKRHALGASHERTMTKEEIAEKLVLFWKSIAEKHGGSVDAAWVEAFVRLDPDGTLHSAESRREVTLTNTPHGTPHIELPVRSLYISKATGKYPLGHTPEEEHLEMQPIVEALRILIS